MLSEVRSWFDGLTTNGRCNTSKFGPIVVVDDDVDAYDISDVLWAMCSRADPVDAVEILRRCWSGPLDPIIPRERKGFSSRMIIDACRPFEWRDRFPPAAEISQERRDAVMAKWKNLMSD